MQETEPASALKHLPIPKHRERISFTMSNTENTAPKQDVYARVTSQIVNAIEAGVSNWRMPWHTSGKFAFSPINVTSKKPYRGVNTVCLWAAAQAKGYERGEWGTYQQWSQLGCQVRKGEKATSVAFWKQMHRHQHSDANPSDADGTHCDEHEDRPRAIEGTPESGLLAYIPRGASRQQSHESQSARWKYRRFRLGSYYSRILTV